MKNNWPIRKLGEICDFQGGSQPPKRQFVFEPRKGYVRFLQIRDFTSNKHVTYISESKKNRLCGESDVLLGRYGASVGKVLTNQKGAYNVAVMKTIPDTNVLCRDYFYYYLTSSEFQKRLSQVAARSAQAGFSKEDIYNFPVLTPPLPEQKRIVSILNEVFEKITKAKKDAEKNLQNSRELFDVYLQSIFTNPSKHWKEEKLGDVCEYFNGKAHEQCIDEEGQYIVVNSKFISSDGRVFKRTNDALFPLSKGGIVMVLSDVPNGKALAKCYLIDQDDTYSLNQRICAIRSDKFQTRFLYYQLNRNRHFLSFDNGENQTNLRLNQILSCPLYLPSITEQKDIARNLDILSEGTNKLESIYQKKLLDLEELKKSVLHRAFNGGLTGVCS